MVQHRVGLRLVWSPVWVLSAGSQRTWLFPGGCRVAEWDAVQGHKESKERLNSSSSKMGILEGCSVCQSSCSHVVPPMQSLTYRLSTGSPLAFLRHPVVSKSQWPFLSATLVIMVFDSRVSMLSAEFVLHHCLLELPSLHTWQTN